MIARLGETKIKNNSYSQIETRFESCERSRFPARKCALPVHEVVQLIVFKISYEVLKFDIIFFGQNLYKNLKELVMNR